MFRMPDEKLIEVLDQALKADDGGFGQLSDFFKKYSPSQEPVFEGLLEILTQRSEDGTLEFGIDARTKAFRAFERQLKIELFELSKDIDRTESVITTESISFSRMLARASRRFYEVSFPLP